MAGRGGVDRSWFAVLSATNHGHGVFVGCGVVVARLGGGNCAGDLRGAIRGCANSGESIQRDFSV